MCILDPDSTGGGGTMEELITCLRDTGCGEELIEEVCRLCAHGDGGMAIRKLRRYRCTLMDELHESQRKVDRLDFLLRQIDRARI